MRSIVHTTVRLGEALVVRDQPFVTGAGDVFGWVDVGKDAELAVYGAPDSLRRLAAALVVAADAAEPLTQHGETPAAARGA